jgi:hypothetical protein
VIITEATYFKEYGKIWTRGKYLVITVLKSGEIYFNGWEPIGKEVI